jgi:hypothetical protein
VLRDTAPGGALLLDPTKLRSEGWRITFAAVLAGVVVALVASGMRALGASSRTLPWSYPAFEDIFGRAESDVAAAQAARAASLLKTAIGRERAEHCHRRRLYLVLEGKQMRREEQS